MEKRKRGRPSKKDQELYNKINGIVFEENTTVEEIKTKLELTEVDLIPEKQDDPNIRLRINLYDINTPRQLLELLKAINFNWESSIPKERLETYPELNQYII